MKANFLAGCIELYYENHIGMINIGEMIGKSVGNKPKKKKMTVKESHEFRN